MKQPKSIQPAPVLVRPQFDTERQMWFVETATDQPEFVEGYYDDEITAIFIAKQAAHLYPKKYKTI